MGAVKFQETAPPPEQARVEDGTQLTLYRNLGTVNWGTKMWGSIFCVVVGLVLLLVAIFGKHFHVGLSVRIPVPAWQGRLWLVISGGLALLTGLSGILGPSHTGVRHSIGRVFEMFDVGYEMFIGIMLLLVGLGFLVARNEKVDIKAKLFGVAGIFCGMIFITDSIWKMRR